MHRCIAALVVGFGVVASGCGSTATPAPARPRGTPPAAARPVPLTVADGERLFNAKRCIACHTVDGSTSSGPTMKGYFGATLTLANGTDVTGDEARFLGSLDRPEPLKDFPPSMAPYGTLISAEERKALVLYVQSLQ